MDETVRVRGAALWRANAAARIEQAARWLGIATPLAVIAGPSFGDIAAGLVGLFFLIHSLLMRRWGWVRQPWMLAGLALWAYLSLRAAMAAEPMAALAAAVPFVRFLIFAAALQNLVLPDPKTRRYLTYAGAFGLTVLALDGLWQYATGLDVTGNARLWNLRITAFYEHAWVGAIIAWLFLPITLALVDVKHTRLALGLAALWLLVMVLSGDRMATLCGLAQLGLLGILTARARRAVLIGLPILVLGLGALFVVAPQTYDRQVSSTLETIKNFPKTQYAEIWSSAWKVAKAHPIFGVGAKGFENVCPDPVYGPLNVNSPIWTRCASHPHNTYLEWLDDGGLIGLSLFVLTMGYLLAAFLPLIRARNPSSWAASGLFITFIARLWPLASWTSFHHAWSAVPFWLVIGWGLALARPPQSRVQ